MPSRSRSRSLPRNPWPTLTATEVNAMIAKADAAMANGANVRSPIIPTIDVSGDNIATLYLTLRPTAEQRGALPLWQKTGML